MALHTSYADVAAREGQLIGENAKCKSKLAEATIRAGLLVVQGTARQQATHPLAIPAADPNAIATAIASAVTAQTLVDVTDLDGVDGISRVAQARRVTVTFDADVGWDTPSGECRVDIYAEDANGAPIKDTVSKANGSGAVTLTTALHCSKVTRVDIEACNAATGTAEIGWSAASVEYGKVCNVGVAVYERAAEPATTAGYDFETNAVFSSCTDGVVAVENETTGAAAAALGDPVYVRVVAAGADLRGQFSGVQSSTDFARVLNMQWKKAAAAGAVGWVEVQG